MSNEGSGIELQPGWDLIKQKGFLPLQSCLDLGVADSRTKFGRVQWVAIYTTVYEMCTQQEPRPYCQELYELARETLSEYLEETSLPALRGTHDHFMLKELVKRWENHKIMVRWVKRVFEYIDRYHVKRCDSMDDLQTLGYTCFHNSVFKKVKTDVTNATIDIIEKERDGNPVDHSLLKNIVGIYVEMGMGNTEIYTSELECAFLRNTASFYSRASTQWAEEDSFPDFMVKAEKCIEQELKRSHSYLDAQTEPKLMNVCETEVLVNHQTRMLEKESSGLVVLLEQNKHEDLARLYRLYSRVNVTRGLVPIAAIIRNHIENEGMAIVAEQKTRVEQSGNDAEKPDFIQSLLVLHNRYNALVTRCFQTNPDLQKAMKEAFEVFVNQQIGTDSTAELFANYCDSLLNSTGIGSKMSEDEVEDQLEQFCNLFSYLTEKDVFQEFSRKQLAKRLLLERSHSEDAERSLIQKLKERCGAHFTSKLSGMITDMNLTRDMQRRFKRSVMAAAGTVMDENAGVSTVSIDGVECSVRVLTTGHWPSYKEEKIELPPELEKCLTGFSKFYHSITEQRILRWVHSLGKSSIETSVFTGNKKIPKIELQVSTNQVCVLMLFNERDEMSFKEIQERLGLQESESAKQCVASLCKKYPLLVRTVPGKGISDEVVFKINVDFSPNKRRLNVPMPEAKISVAEKEATHSVVVEDRKHAIEAAIVRVMKKRQELEHQQLIAEVSRLLMTIFRPEPRQIKNRLEDLIAREYLERDQDDNSLYRYLA